MQTSRNRVKGIPVGKRFFLGLSMACLFCFTGVVTAHGQGSVKGVVQSSSGDPVAYASVILQKAPAAPVKEAVADSTGSFLITEVPEGLYKVQASAAGYDSSSSEVQVKKNAGSVPLIIVLRQHETLGSVVVKGRRRTIEQSIDKMTLNIENTLLAEGNTALELLERAPGVKVDEEGKISLRGKPGVTIMLNGKLTYLSAGELANLLKATNAASVSKIEIITNPSARYDAAGNAGIINIVMKKHLQRGFNGTVNAHAGAGRNARYGAGFNLNYRSEMFNIYGNYSYAYRGETEFLDFTRQFYEPGIPGRMSLQRTETDEPLHTMNFRAGVDFTPDSLNSIGLLINGNDGRYYHNSETLNRLTQAPDVLLTEAHTQNRDKQHWSSLTYNLNYLRKFSKKGRELSVDLDFVPNRFSSDLTLDTYTQPNTELPQGKQEQRRGNNPSRTDVYVLKSDYSDVFNEKMKWEAGVKSSVTDADNDLQYHNRVNDQWVFDPATSNHFRYKEQIHAGYLNTSIDLGKTGLHAGLRGEYTKTTGHQVTTGDLFTRDYFQLFPNMALSRKWSDAHQLQAAYSRRIERPNYGSLNPFRLFRDPSLYYEGNPYLKPELTQHLTVNYILKNRYTTSVSYSRTTDVITWVSGQNDATHTTFEKPQNLPSLVNYGISITAQLHYTSWWSATHFANLFHNTYDLGDAKNAQTSFSINTQNSFTPGKGFGAELNAYYNSASVYGILTEKAYYAVSAAVQKTIMKERGSLKLAVNDIFQTQNYRHQTRYRNINMNSTVWLDSRRAILSFTYRFGGQFSTRERKTGSEDIQNRIR